jgi:hypothetical protein
VALLVPNLWWRSLGYYVSAMAVYAFVTATISFWLLHHRLGVLFCFDRAKAWKLVRDAAVDFTVWLHLSGRARLFLQRGALAVLGSLGVALPVIGQYTVAVNLAGFATILPGVLENVAAVQFAHHPSQRRRDLRKFFGLACVVAAGQVGGALMLGRTVLRLLHVVEVERVYSLFLTLLLGVTAYAVAAPALAYAMCFYRMRKVFLRLFVPATVLSAVSIWLAARQWGGAGAALAQAAVLASTAAVAIVMVAVGRDQSVAAEPETAAVESAFQE